MPPPGTPIYLLPEGVTAVNVQQTINQASIPIIDCQVHPYLEPSNRTMRITKKGSNTVVTLVAGRVDSRWFKSILPVAFEEKGLFQCYFFIFPYKELTATMQGCHYHCCVLSGTVAGIMNMDLPLKYRVAALQVLVLLF